MMEKLQRIMKKQLSQKEKIILSITIAIWGVVLIGSGLILNSQNRTITETMYSLTINKHKVAQQRTNEIKLKDLEIEINTPLSVDIKDYLEDTENLDNSIYQYLKLDTSTVKNTEAGDYTYTITYKKKKYTGKIKIKEKELPNVNLQLKNIKLEVGSPISTDLTTYINTPLTDEMKNNITLDISKINNSVVGTYQYSVVYNKTTYVGTVEIYNPQPSGAQVITPGNDNNNNNNNTTDTTNNNP